MNFLNFLDNDDRMSSKRRNLSALVFPINLRYISRFIILEHTHPLAKCPSGTGSDERRLYLQAMVIILLRE